MEVTFGDRLKAVRKQKGITQAELANTLGISEQSINRYEKSHSFPTYKQLLRLEEFFGVSLHPTYAQEGCSKAVSIQCEDTQAGKVAEAFSPEQVALLKQMLRETILETLRGFITEFDSFNKAFRGTPPKVDIDRGKELPTLREFADRMEKLLPSYDQTNQSENTLTPAQLYRTPGE